MTRCEAGRPALLEILEICWNLQVSQKSDSVRLFVVNVTDSSVFKRCSAFVYRVTSAIHLTVNQDQCDIGLATMPGKCPLKQQ